MLREGGDGLFTAASKTTHHGSALKVVPLVSHLPSVGGLLLLLSVELMAPSWPRRLAISPLIIPLIPLIHTLAHSSVPLIHKSRLEAAVSRPTDTTTDSLRVSRRRANLYNYSDISAATPLGCGGYTIHHVGATPPAMWRVHYPLHGSHTIRHVGETLPAASKSYHPPRGSHTTRHVEVTLPVAWKLYHPQRRSQTTRLVEVRLPGSWKPHYACAGSNGYRHVRFWRSSLWMLESVPGNADLRLAEKSPWIGSSVW